MPSTSLVQNRDHLQRHRRSLIARSLAASIVGAMPVPFLDDYLVSKIRQKTIRKIAEYYEIDASPEAIAAIADGLVQPPNFATLVGGGLLSRLAKKQWKKIFALAIAAQRGRAAARHFEIATLFDHYCARLHVGFGLDGPKAKLLRSQMEQARENTKGGIGQTLFARGLRNAASQGLELPQRAFQRLESLTLGRLLQSGSEPEIVAEVEELVDSDLTNEGGLLQRSAMAIELLLSADKNSYIDKLLDSFDSLVTDSREK